MSVNQLIFLLLTLLLTGLALLGAILLRQRLLQQKLQLEITNEGNIPVHLRLHAEHPDRLLAFRCRGQGVHIATDDSPPPKEFILIELENQPLKDQPQPEPPPADPAEPPPENTPGKSSLGARIDQGLRSVRRLSGSLASGATSLPRPLKEPLMRLSSRLQQLQLRAIYARRQPMMLARFAQRQPQAQATNDLEAIHGSPSPNPDQELKDAIPLDRRAWMETPLLAPGEAMKLQIKVFPFTWHNRQEYIFRVLSYAVEAPAEPWAITQIPVRIRGGFWVHPYAPLLVIGTVAVLVLILVFV